MRLNRFLSLGQLKGRDLGTMYLARHIRLPLSRVQFQSAVCLSIIWDSRKGIPHIPFDCAHSGGHFCHLCSKVLQNQHLDNSPILNHHWESRQGLFREFPLDIFQCISKHLCAFEWGQMYILCIGVLRRIYQVDCDSNIVACQICLHN